MNLSDMANYVTTQVGLTDTDDVSAAQLFIRNHDELIYNSELWKDAMIGVDYGFDPVNNPDNNEGVMLVPPVIDVVAGARVAAAPGVWGNSLRIHGMEDYYRVDWDWFSQTGVPFEFAEMTPVWFNFWNNAAGLQLVNLNIADSGTACEIIWYDDNGTKHVQVAVPGNQFVQGGVNQPPVQVPASSLPVSPTPAPLWQIFRGNYGGALPTFIPPNGVGIAFDDVTGQMFSYFNSQWH